MKTLKELAQRAIDVQDTCNPLGVSKSYAEDLSALRTALGEANLPNGTDALCNHPINRLWVSKLHDLAGMGLSDTERFGKAYDACKELAGE